jgi:serine O-acetyltransferase
MSALDTLPFDVAAALRRGQELLPAAAGPLPSRPDLEAVAHRLRAVLFGRHRSGTPTIEAGVDGFVADTLAGTLPLLQEQVRRDLQRSGRTAGDAVLPLAQALTRQFLGELPAIHAMLLEDLAAADAGDPAATSRDEIVLCYPGFQAVVLHRLAHALHARGVPLVARCLAAIAQTWTGVDIHPAARIGPGFFIDHGTGVVIGATAVLGARVRLYQGVTLGARSFRHDGEGALVKGEPRHPILHDDVLVFSGAAVLGRITIGRGARIGAGVVVVDDVPPGARVTALPARHHGYHDGAGI